MKKNLPLLPALTGLLLLTGCGAPVGLAAWEAGGAYVTKPGTPDDADLTQQMPQHQSWCYSTMGEQVECYTEPQETPPGRLVNVDPPNLYPMNAREYRAAVARSRAADQAAEAAAAKIATDPSVPVMTPVVAPAEVTVAPVTTAPIQIAPQPTKPVVKKHKKKVKKPVATPPAATTPPDAVPNSPN